MHPGQNNSPEPLWSVQDKGFIIDLRLIVTLWITRVCTPRTRLRSRALVRFPSLSLFARSLARSLVRASTTNGTVPYRRGFDLLLISRQMLIEWAALQRLEIHGGVASCSLLRVSGVPARMDRFAPPRADKISPRKRRHRPILIEPTNFSRRVPRLEWRFSQISLFLRKTESLRASPSFRCTGSRFESQRRRICF